MSEFDGFSEEDQRSISGQRWPKMKKKEVGDLRARIQKAAGDLSPATSLTHPLYRYPASMSPVLARELIMSFTRPGDIVLDPFCGGGTTAVESLSVGRKVICSDVNPLASFITLAKAWPLKDKPLQILEEWFLAARDKLRKEVNSVGVPVVTRTGRTYSPKTHSLLILLRNLADSIPTPQVRRAARLITLQVGKHCFDCRNNPPSPKILMKHFERVFQRARFSIQLYSLECFQWEVSQSLRQNLQIYNCSVHELPKKLERHAHRIGFVLTSPPYPGIHVLYNRWQIYGRGETDLPYFLLNLSDGQPGSYYTLGDRKETGNETYFHEIAKAFYGMRQLLTKNAVVAQVVSFSDPKAQLNKYRKLMHVAGYQEIPLGSSNRNIISREIPNRRWYTTRKGGAPAAREYILIHKLS